MRINKLEIENIRSYEKAEIEFPSGRILFEGDIGSGKSTILYAIEFALFGLGDMKATDLLRKGAKAGSVKVELQVAGKQYKLYRQIEASKKDQVKQKAGYIEDETGRLELSSTEMRQKVLKILNFKENPETKASSVIYRYAVFTPQEEMKKILELNPELRLQTLRKAFGIEDYKIAKDNSTIITKELRSRSAFMEGQTSDLEQLESEHTSAIEKMEKIKAAQRELTAAILQKTGAAEKLQKELEQLQEEKQKNSAMKAELPLIEAELHKTKKQVAELLNRNASYEMKTGAQKKLLQELKNNAVTAYRPLQDVQTQLDQLKKEQEERAVGLGKITGRIDNYRQLLEKGVCPTCEQSIAGDFHNKLKTVETEHGKGHDVLMRLQVQIRRLEEEKEAAHEGKFNQEKLIMIIEEIEDRKKEIGINEDQIARLEKEIHVMTRGLDEKRSRIDGGIFEQYDRISREKQQLDSELRQVLSQESAMQQQATDLDSLSEKLETQIRQKKELLKSRAHVTNTHDWLQQQFVPAVDTIEKHVLTNINEEFNTEFQKWFNTLVEAQEIDAQVDESFTPLIEQNGYDISVNALSGGEKTSIALEYRLALYI